VGGGTAQHSAVQHGALSTVRGDQHRAQSNKERLKVLSSSRAGRLAGMLAFSRWPASEGRAGAVGAPGSRLPPGTACAG
jgi:hypothetical protein